jgi:predicted TPR repeat methyltransferase
MSSPDDGLRTAMAAHKAGRLDEAEAGYGRVLEVRPADPKALYYLGLLSFHRGETEAALALLRRCLARAPSNGVAWNTLGSMLASAGCEPEAMEAYRRATEVTPAMGEGWYNLGVCHSNAGDVDGAVQHFRAGTTHQPGYARCHEALATLLYRLGRAEEAAEAFRNWAAHDPANPTAAHMAAAASQTEVPPRAADEYVRILFDSSAGSFDSDLERLGYRAPTLVADALASAAAGRILPAVLDAGCGTGWCGPLVRKHCTSLVGIDLSPRMLERARERACYDQLTVAELAAFMRSLPGAFDAIVSADTLVYFGSLEQPLRAAAVTLREGGCLIFTAELLTGERAADYRLELHGRYAHTETYIRSALSAAGFELQTFSREALREERGLAVPGCLVGAQKR